RGSPDSSWRWWTKRRSGGPGCCGWRRGRAVCRRGPRYRQTAPPSGFLRGAGASAVAGPGWGGRRRGRRLAGVRRGEVLQDATDLLGLPERLDDLGLELGVVGGAGPQVDERFLEGAKHPRRGVGGRGRWRELHVRRRQGDARAGDDPGLA